MIAVTVIAARWVIQHFQVPSPWPTRAAMGGLALLLMLLAEFSLVLWLRGMSIAEYFATRDPVSGTAYYLALAIFAAMPLFIRR